MINNIYQLYARRCYENGNIHEHLPLLHTLSMESEGVLEIGVENGVSSTALIAGQDWRANNKKYAFYFGIDINPSSASAVDILARACTAQFPISFKAGRGAETQTPHGRVDLLFIDSLHTEDNIRRELNFHLDKVNKFVVLHDTETFGEKGEKEGTRGILHGIGLLLDTTKWIKYYDSPRNNGLVVFLKKPVDIPAAV